jgi:hypothetical protein
MAKVKGIKKLNKAISAPLVKRFGISKAVCSSEYSYIFEDESITFKLTEGTTEDEWFAEFIKERFGYEVKYPFVISLLHEVGHHKANDDIDGMVYDFCMAEKERINAEMQDADADRSKALEWQYFNLPDEIMATQWAVAYAKKHPKIVEKMWAEMAVALMDFYRVNGVLDSLEPEE